MKQFFLQCLVGVLLINSALMAMEGEQHEAANNNNNVAAQQPVQQEQADQERREEEVIAWQNLFQDDRADDDMLRAAGILNNDPVENPMQAPLPAPRGPFFREPLRPDNSKMYLIGASVVALAAGTYGLCKLIVYMASSDANTRKDIKTALVDLLKEVKKAKEDAQGRTYKNGTLPSYFNAQVDAGSFSALNKKTLQVCAAISIIPSSSWQNCDRRWNYFYSSVIFSRSSFWPLKINLSFS